MPPDEDAPPKYELPRRSRDDSKRETREALIVAGIAAFAEEGLDAPSLDSICARAGFTRGAFYVHFKDREDFLIAVMTKQLEALFDAVIATGDAAFDLERTIEMYVTALVAGTLPSLGTVQFHQLLAACARSSRVREQTVQVIGEGARRVATAVREGQGAGTVRPDVQADQIATLLVALVAGAQTLFDLQYPYDAVAASQDLSRMLKRPR